MFFGSETLENKIYILLNKPCGYVCSSVSDSHKTVYSLLPEKYQSLLKAKRGERLHTVGRLDCDTSGLLLITNDGQFSNYLARPENRIKKTYLVTLKYKVDKKQQSNYIKQAKQGIVLPPEKKAPEQKTSCVKIKFINDTECKVTLTQGMFHEVKRIFLFLGNEVTTLKRIKMAKYKLPKTLNQGEYILLEKNKSDGLLHAYGRRNNRGTY